MAEAHNPRLKALILEVVDNQLSDNDPPATRITLERLMSYGYSRKRAKEMIGSVVAEFIYYSMHDGKKFDVAKYTESLEKLS